MSTTSAMNSWDFCFWLRGFLEGAGDELGSEQVASIKQKLEETIAKDSEPSPPVAPINPFGPLYGPTLKW